MTYLEVARLHGLRMTHERTDSNPHMTHSATMDHWRCTIWKERRRMTLTFSKGRGHHGQPPTIAEVLRCLAMDATTLDQSFESWARDMGFDSDSRSAERIFNATVNQTTKLRRLVGADAMDDLAAAEE